MFSTPKGALHESLRQKWKGVSSICSRQAQVQGFRFHDLRHTFTSWYMMNGGDLYELAKILGHSNIKMTERYAKLDREHIARLAGWRGRCGDWQEISEISDIPYDVRIFNTDR